jgi:hypothetical protein
LALAAALWLSAGASPVRAYDRQIGLTLESGYSLAPNLPAHGVFAEIGLSIGLGDTWEIRARAAYAYHPEPMHRIAGGAELVYLVDVFELVPFVGLGAAGIATDVSDVWSADFAVDLVAGLDVLLSRAVTLGAVLRPALVVTAIDRAPLWFEGGLRVQVLFPY